MQSYRPVWASLIFLCLMSTSAFAQNSDASLSGSVLDSTGAAIP